jgi:hypothetical protein
MLATIVMTFFLIIFMFLVVMFIVYFDYMLSIARLSLYLSISSYSIHPNDHAGQATSSHVDMHVRSA